MSLKNLIKPLDEFEISHYDVNKYKGMGGWSRGKTVQQN